MPKNACILINMDSSERFVLVCKPEQSGKTFLMIQQIIKDIEEPSDKTVINFIFCDNSLLLVQQTSDRLKKDVAKFTLNDECYIEFSSNAQHTMNDVMLQIIMEDIRNVISCTNASRVRDISNIIDEFNTKPLTRDKYEFKIWLDEADKFSKFIYNVFAPLLDLHNNVMVYCLTATPDALFKKFDNMNVFPIENTTSEEYHGWDDNELVIIEDGPTNTVEFIHYVLTNHVETSNGSKWFLPGDTKKASHYEIRDMAIALGFAVFVVNGDGIELSWPEGADYKREVNVKDTELNKQMMQMYETYHIDRFPLAITGKICVGRGISIMSPDFILDGAILFNCSNKSEASQNAGRTKGNLKKWSNYKPPKVYTTPKFNAIAAEWERKSRRLAELAYENDHDNPSSFSNAEFKSIGDARLLDFDHKEFTDDNDAIRWVKTTFNKKQEKCALKAPKEMLQNGCNPTLEYVLQRKWGLTSTQLKKAIRKVRLNDDTICVYWRPSNMV